MAGINGGGDEAPARYVIREYMGLSVWYGSEGRLVEAEAHVNTFDTCVD
jgi:hypothetical protein